MPTLRIYFIYMLLRDLLPTTSKKLVETSTSSSPSSPIKEPDIFKDDNLDMAWEYASDHKRFVNMLRVSPEVFDTLLYLMNDDPKQLNVSPSTSDNTVSSIKSNEALYSLATCHKSLLH